MWIDLGNLHTRVTRSTPAELEWLVGYLTFKNPKARFTGAKKEQSLYSPLSGAFPSGFVPLVRKAAAEEGIDVQVFDARRPPCQRDPAADLTWLRDYQLEAVDAACAEHRGILHLPTGAGKTEIAVGLTRALPCRWLFLVDGAGLMQDAADRYNLRNAGTREPAGRIGDGLWLYDDAFTAATFATVRAALKGPSDRRARMRQILAAAEGVLIDECHTLPAESHYEVAMLLGNAYYRIGMSGTPLARGDRRSLLAVSSLGPVIYRVRTDELTRKGAVSRGKVTLVEFEHARPTGVTWNEVYQECVVQCAERNRLLVEMARTAQKPSLLFVREIDHGRDLERRLLKAGIAAAFVWGKHSIGYRRSRVAELVAGRFDVLVCSDIFQKGVDIPSLGSVVVGGEGASTIATLQRLGRAMRTDAASGKDRFEVWDVSDKGDPWLERHSRARFKAYLSEGHDTSVIKDLPGLLLPGTHP